MCGFFLVIANHENPIDSAIDINPAIRASLSQRGKDRFTQQALSINSYFRGIFYHSLLSIYGWDLQANESNIAPRALDFNTVNAETLSYNGEIYSIRHKNSRDQTFESDEYFLLDHLQSLDLDSSKDIAGLQLDVDGQYSFVYTIGKNILLSRDFHGHKPLFYFQSCDLLVASSSLPLLRIYLTKLGLCNISNQSHSAPSFYNLPYRDEAACSLLAGSTMLFNLEEDKLKFKQHLSIHSYQKLCVPIKPITQISLKEGFRLAVESILPRSRPYCLLLSGGYDSALLLSTLCELQSPPVVAITYDNGHNSLDVASAIALAKLFNIKHIVLRPNRDDHQQWLDMLHVYNLPSDPANEAVYHLLRAASEFSRIVLCGDGGDEISRRYRRFIYYKKPFARLLSCIHFFKHYNKRYVASASSIRSECDYVSTQERISKKHKPLSVLHRIAHRSSTPIDMYKIPECFFSASYDLPMSYELLINLPERLLSKTEQIGYSLGVEVRSPFLSTSFSSQLVRENSRSQNINASKLLLDRNLAKLVSACKTGLA